MHQVVSGEIEALEGSQTHSVFYFESWATRNGGEGDLRRLKRGVPRAYKDHRSVDAKRYSDVVAALVERLGGTPPPGSRPLLKEYGRCALTLDWLHEELQHATARRRLVDARRLRREIKVARFMLLRLEGQIEKLAGIRADASDLARAIQHELALEEAL